MSKKIYVGNLSYSTTEVALQKCFSEYGEVVSSKIILDRDTGRSKGFAFIEMTSDEEALVAIQKLDGYEQDGRPIKVNEAKPQRPRFDRPGFSNTR